MISLSFKHYIGVQVSELDTINGQLADGKFAVNDIERRCRVYYKVIRCNIYNIIQIKAGCRGELCRGSYSRGADTDDDHT